MELKECDELTKKIFLQVAKYNLFDYFEDKDEMFSWIKQLTEREINNFLSLNVDIEKIKFDKGILIDSNLLKTKDYLKRVEEIVSIDNADGWYHLFKNLITKDFLESDRFYKDIEKLKTAHSAQIPLWIIGDRTFINSPYHDEDFDMLISKIPKSNEEYDYVSGEAIASLSANELSIYSGHHQRDMQDVYNSSSDILQSTNSFPKRSINNLAEDRLSLNDPFHQENMEILKSNPEIGNFLYAVMTDEKVLKRQDYRRIIRKMVEHKDDEKYAFLVCAYILGLDEAKLSLNLTQQIFIYELGGSSAIQDKAEQIYLEMNTIDAPYIENETYREESKPKTFFKKLFKK